MGKVSHAGDIPELRSWERGQPPQWPPQAAALSSLMDFGRSVFPVFHRFPVPRGFWGHPGGRERLCPSGSPHPTALPSSSHSGFPTGEGSSCVPGTKPCPEHPTFLRDPAAVAPLDQKGLEPPDLHGPTSRDPLPRRTHPFSFEILLHPRLFLWGTELGKAGRARGMPGQGFMAAGSLPGPLTPLRLLTPVPSRNLRRATRLPGVTQGQGSCVGKDVRDGGTAPWG